MEKTLFFDNKRTYFRPKIKVRSLESELLQGGGIHQVSTGDTGIEYGGEGGDDDEPRAKWGDLWEEDGFKKYGNWDE